MVFRTLVILSAAFLSVLAGCSGGNNPSVASYAGGFAAPESIVYDERTDSYLVSNINDKGDAANGNGYISRISPASGEIDYTWIDGRQADIELNKPKGLAISGRHLVVADISSIRIFDLDTRQPLASIPIEGATSLNGICAAPDGSIYVTDSAFDDGIPGIYRLQEQKVSVIYQGDTLGTPNGCLHDGQALWVADFASSRLWQQTEAGGEFGSINLPSGRLDGIVRGNGSLTYVSSWQGSSILAIAGDGSIHRVAAGLEKAAAIGFDTSRNLILVPLLSQDKVVAVADLGE